VRQQGDEAVVAIDVVTHPSRYRYDLFPPAKLVSQEVKLVREAGAWRVDLPPIEDFTRGPAWHPQEFGPVDVMMPEQYHPGLIDNFEATAVLRASRDALERALRDPQRWALALPGIHAIEPAERLGDYARIRFRFEDPDRTGRIDADHPDRLPRHQAMARRFGATDLLGRALGPGRPGPREGQPLTPAAEAHGARSVLRFNVDATIRSGITA
jgi:hypothetical protein